MAIENTYNATNASIIQTAQSGVPDRGPLSEAGKLRRGGQGLLETKTETFARKHNELLQEFKNGGWLSNAEQLNQLEGKIWAFEKKYVETKNPDRALRDQAILDLKYINTVSAKLRENLKDNTDEKLRKHSATLNTIATRVLFAIGELQSKATDSTLRPNYKSMADYEAAEGKKTTSTTAKVAGAGVAHTTNDRVRGGKIGSKEAPEMYQRAEETGGEKTRKYYELGDKSTGTKVDFEKETRKAKEKREAHLADIQSPKVKLKHIHPREHITPSMLKERQAEISQAAGKSSTKEAIYPYEKSASYENVTREAKQRAMGKEAFAARKAELEPKLKANTAARAEKDKAERDAVGSIKQELIGAINIFKGTKEGKTIQTALQKVVTQLEKKDLSKEELNRIATNFYDTTFEKFVDKQDKFSVSTVLRQANELKEKASDLFDVFVTAEDEATMRSEKYIDDLKEGGKNSVELFAEELDELDYGKDVFEDAEEGEEPVSGQQVTTRSEQLQQKQVNKQLEQFFKEKLVELSKLPGYEGLREMITAKTPSGQTLIVTVDDQIELLMKQGMPAMLRKMDLQGMQIAIGRTTAGLNATVVKQRFIEDTREAAEKVQNAGKALIDAFIDEYELDESESDQDASLKLLLLLDRFNKIDKEPDIKELGREVLDLIKKLTTEASNSGMNDKTLLAWHELNKLVEW